MDRRRFVEAVGAAAAGALLPGALAGCGAPRGAGALPPIGLQLYTVRGILQRDFAGTLAQVAAVGYREVEFAGYFGHAPAEVRALLDRHGLTAPAAHIGVPDAAAWRAALEAAATIGHRYVIVPWVPPERRRTLDDWRRIAAEFNRLGAEARAAGLQFAYHNHDFEFVPLGGQVPYDLLLAETDPALVQLEIDLYWITKAGHDPLAYFARYPGRVPLVHVKDSGGPPEHRQVDVGAGTIDFPKILARREQAGLRHWFVEHDEPADPLAFIRASYEYLAGLKS